jgi:nucleoside-diphosphate-sugar epimerase
VGAQYARTFGLQVKTARCFAFVGPYLPLDIHFAIGNFIRDGLKGGPIVVKGDGTPLRSYLYAADLVIWLWTILCKGEAGTVYNVGSPDALTIREVAEQVSAVFSPVVPVVLMRSPVLGMPSERYVPDVHRAHLELGLDPGINLREALARTVAWYRSNTD